MASGSSWTKEDPTEDLLSCAVCYEKYDTQNHRPLLLSCHHTFCDTCLQGIVVNGSVTCPTCRLPTTCPGGAVAKLQRNFYLDQMRDLISHNVCRKHGLQRFSFYCQTCQVSVCRDCSVLDHNETKGPHKLVEIEIAAENFKKSLEDLKSEALVKQIKCLHQSLVLEQTLHELQTTVSNGSKWMEDCIEALKSVKESAEKAIQLNQSQWRRKLQSTLDLSLSGMLVTTEICSSLDESSRKFPESQDLHTTASMQLDEVGRHLLNDQALEKTSNTASEILFQVKKKFIKTIFSFLNKDVGLEKSTARNDVSEAIPSTSFSLQFGSQTDTFHLFSSVCDSAVDYIDSANDCPVQCDETRLEALLDRVSADQSQDTEAFLSQISDDRLSSLKQKHPGLGWLQNTDRKGGSSSNLAWACRYKFLLALQGCQPGNESVKNLDGADLASKRPLETPESPDLYGVKRIKLESDCLLSEIPSTSSGTSALTRHKRSMSSILTRSTSEVGLHSHEKQNLLRTMSMSCLPETGMRTTTEDERSCESQGGCPDVQTQAYVDDNDSEHSYDDDCDSDSSDSDYDYDYNRVLLKSVGKTKQEATAMLMTDESDDSQSSTDDDQENQSDSDESEDDDYVQNTNDDEENDDNTYDDSESNDDDSDHDVIDVIQESNDDFYETMFKKNETVLCSVCGLEIDVTTATTDPNVELDTETETATFSETVRDHMDWIACDLCHKYIHVDCLPSESNFIADLELYVCGDCTYSRRIPLVETREITQ